MLDTHSCFISLFIVLPNRPLQSTLESRSRRSPVPSTTSSFPMTRSNLVVPRQEALPFRYVPLMLFGLGFIRQNLTNCVCTQISCLYDPFYSDPRDPWLIIL